MSDQATIILRRDDDGSWELRMAIGEPGLEHARQMNAQVGPISHETASFALGLFAGAADPDGELGIADGARRLAA